MNENVINFFPLISAVLLMEGGTEFDLTVLSRPAKRNSERQMSESDAKAKP